MNAPTPYPTKIWISGPSITETEVALVTEAAREGWYANAYRYHQRFESEWARVHGVPHALSTSNCTAALHLGLRALNVGPGDEVIVPDTTWIATAAAITYVGAKPVFADIDPATWCVDPVSVEALLTPRTKAILGVDLYGNMADWDALRALADKHGLGLLEDAAEAVGATYKGRLAGTLGDLGVYSFHGTKTFTTGEGGMFVTARKELYDRAAFLRNHGRDPKRAFWHLEVGYKYMMSPLQAALGCAQLTRLDELVAMKRRAFQWYRSALEGIGGLTLNVEPEGTTSTFWMPSVILDPATGWTKEALIEAMAPFNIDARPFFYPLSSMPAFVPWVDGREAARNPVAYRLGAQGVNLPGSLALTEAETRYIGEVLRWLLGRRP